MIHLGAGDDGRSVEADVGETVELVLDEPVGGGYQWSWEIPDGLSEVVDDHRPAGVAPGAAGQRALQVQVHRPGAHRLGASLGRPWEGGSIQQLTVQIVAAG